MNSRGGDLISVGVLLGDRCELAVAGALWVWGRPRRRVFGSGWHRVGAGQLLGILTRLPRACRTRGRVAGRYAGGLPAAAVSTRRSPCSPGAGSARPTARWAARRTARGRRWRALADRRAAALAQLRALGVALDGSCSAPTAPDCCAPRHGSARRARAIDNQATARSQSRRFLDSDGPTIASSIKTDLVESRVRAGEQVGEVLVFVHSASRVRPRTTWTAFHATDTSDGTRRPRTGSPPPVSLTPAP